MFILLYIINSFPFFAMSRVPLIKILKIVFENTTKQLVHIFNVSLNSGKVPIAWKIATVIPIHKGGDRRNVNNYRPISLLSLPGKMLERFVHSQMSGTAAVSEVMGLKGTRKKWL